MSRQSGRRAYLRRLAARKAARLSKSAADNGSSIAVLRHSSRRALDYNFVLNFRDVKQQLRDVKTQQLVQSLRSRLWALEAFSGRSARPDTAVRMVDAGTQVGWNDVMPGDGAPVGQIEHVRTLSAGGKAGMAIGLASFAIAPPVALGVVVGGTLIAGMAGEQIQVASGVPFSRVRQRFQDRKARQKLECVRPEKKPARHTNPPCGRLGLRVTLSGGRFHGKTGVVLYEGPVLKRRPGRSVDSRWYLGVDLDLAVGDHDGTLHGKYYFKGKESCGVFILPSGVSSMSS